jgi:hypothetical protein
MPSQSIKEEGPPWRNLDRFSWVDIPYRFYEASMAIRFRAAAVATIGLVFPWAARADIIVLNDGQQIEGEVTDAGEAWRIKTKYGELTVVKGDVKKVLKSPNESVAEAESLRKKARQCYDEALKTEDPSERNRRLEAGLDLLDRALKVYNETREIFWGSAYSHLDKSITGIIQEMRLYRDKKTSAVAAVPPPTPAAGPSPEVRKAPEARPSPAAAAAAVAPAHAAAVLNPPPPPPVALGDPLAALGSPDIQVRRRAMAAVLALPKTPEIAQILEQHLSKETDGQQLVALANHLADFEPPIALKALSQPGTSGTPEQRRAAVLGVKRLDSEAAASWLIDSFLLKNDTSLLPEVTSALKKMKRHSLPILIRHVGKATEKDVRKLLVKVLGVIGDPKAAPVLVPLVTSSELQSIPEIALIKIGRPSIPHLIHGLQGTPEQRGACGFLLRRLTRQPWNSTQTPLWVHWWGDHTAQVEAELQRREQMDAERDWPVTLAQFKEYDHALKPDKDKAKVRPNSSCYVARTRSTGCFLFSLQPTAMGWSHCDLECGCTKTNGNDSA